MSKDYWSDESKRMRRRINGRLKRLKNRYWKTLKEGQPFEDYKYDFIELLEQQIECEWYGIEIEKYPIFFDNVFKAIGLELYAGKIPTLSGVQPSEPFHLAYDNSRYILIGNQPSDLYARIGEIQPLSTKPIIGVNHTTWTEIDSNEKGHDDWEDEYTRISRALGIGRLQIRSIDTLRQGILLDPIDDKEKLIHIAKEVGLLSFLNTPIDDLPIYGSLEGKRRELYFTEKNVKKMFINSIKKGHFLGFGRLSNYEPTEALKNPLGLLNELKKMDYIYGKKKIIPTQSGIRYIDTTISNTPEEAALFVISEQSLLDNIQKEFEKIEAHLTERIIDSRDKVIERIDNFQFKVEKQIDESAAIKAKYIIDTPPLSPIKCRIEIPIGQLSEEDLELKIAEIQMKLSNVPYEVKTAFINTINKISGIPKMIREKITSAIRK